VAAELGQTSKREAENVRTAAEAEADKLLVAAHEQADELLRAAETHARDLADSADSIWRERRRLIEDVRLLGEQLGTLADTEANRFPNPATRTEHTPETGRARHDLAATLQNSVDSAAPEESNKTHVRR
jgi:cell division septum initiation protein DivIVA